MSDDFTPFPLHFEVVPKTGAPAHAELLGAGMLLAWLALRGGLAKKLAKDVKKLRAGDHGP